jgi:tetratricopeptide (TPR) repeat protein
MTSPAGNDPDLLRIERLLGSDPEEALRQARADLEKRPADPAATLLLALAQRASGDPEAAIATLEKSAIGGEHAPMADLQLGLALREAGRADDALAPLHRAVAGAPDFAEAWLTLADLQIARRETAAADAAFASYLRHSARVPPLAEAARNLQSGQLADAELVLRRRLQRHPNDVAALYLLADACARAGRPDHAADLLQRAVALAPGQRRARHNLAVALLKLNRLADADDQCRQLLASNPADTAASRLHAAVLMAMREYDAAIAVYEKLLDADPRQPGTWLSIGHALRSVGRLDDCINAYRRAAEIDPDSGEAWWSLANLKTAPFSDEDLEAMRTRLRRPDLGADHRTHFHFALGRALEERGDYEGAFREYTDGNRIQRERNAYNPRDLPEFVQRCRELMTREFFASRDGSGAGDADPVFIVGLPRAGSTLVEQILASHSAIEGTAELPDIGILAGLFDADGKSGNGPGYPGVLANLTPERLTELGRSFLDSTRVQRKLGRSRFTDKHPNNFLHIGLIHLILPNARIIDVRRHPLACGLSLFTQHFARGQQFSYSLEDIGRWYRDYVELMAHFDAVLPGRIHRVQYEALVGDPETEIRKLLEYCGLPYESACLRFHENPRAISTPSSQQVRSPIYVQALEHWRRFEPWLGPLKEALGPLADRYPATAVEFGPASG